MKFTAASRTTRRFEQTLSRSRPARYVLRLYVAGASIRSRQALVRARRFCETELSGAYDLEVIDIYQQPTVARDAQILATPTLVRKWPRPLRRFIGNLASIRDLLVGPERAT